MEYLLESPIIYETDETLSIASNSHLHAHLLSVLFDSRFHFSHQKLGMNIRKMLAEGYGFYVTYTQVNVHKKILQQETPIHVKSYIKRYLRVASSGRVHIPFEIFERASNDLIANGILETAVVDTRIAKGRLLPIEDWKYFSHKLTSEGAAFLPFEKDTALKPKITLPPDAEKINRKVKESEIDLYQHVSTTNYLRYMYDTLSNPQDYVKSQVIFKRSLLKDNEFVILKKDEGSKVFFEIKDPSLKTTYTLGLLEKGS